MLKKQLDKIYSRLNYKSAVEFGITDNASFKLLEEKTKQINYLHKFYDLGNYFSLLLEYLLII